MATATFVKTATFTTDPSVKSTAIIDIDGTEYVVSFWSDIIGYFGKDDTKIVLCANGLYENGFQEDAHDLLKPDAKGKLVLDEQGQVKTDDRNWQQRWLDDYPLVSIATVPDVDPLL